ncbi:hypothetical protein B7494_g4297 [Chlorociboria aeruginascens]|nr:hypothetical protein B7494_g4297 [Chlorociboria aeruginascens]
MTTLLTLPPELLDQILSLLPKSTLRALRSQNKLFSKLCFPLIFTHLPHWLCYKTSHRSIIAVAEDAYGRPAAMWSPWATGPDGPIEDIWLKIVWKFHVGQEFPAGRVEEDEDEDVLTGHNFAALSGKGDMTYNRLRTAQNRFLMHRSYTGDRKD